MKDGSGVTEDWKVYIMTRDGHVMNLQERAGSINLVAIIELLVRVICISNVNKGEHTCGTMSLHKHQR